MKSIKKILKLSANIILVTLALGVIIVFAAFIYFYFYFGDKCLDVGGVWDSDRHECRYDCDKWIEGQGCIVFDKTKAE